ncbi:MAG: hypothetical protein ACNA8G_11840 [Gammaproteobacteria bacterium]
MLNLSMKNEKNNDVYDEEYFRAAFGIAPLPADSERSSWIRDSRLPEKLVAAMEEQFEKLLGDKEFVYVTVHMDVQNIRRKVLAEKNPNVLPLGRMFIQSIDAGSPVQTAYENMFVEFFRLIERELQCYLDSIRVYENDGKHFKRGAPVTHVHMCIPVPKGRTYYRFINVFARVFAAKVYPVPIPAEVAKKQVKPELTLKQLKENPKEIWATQMLHFKPGFKDAEGSSADYSIKQIIDAETFSDRFFADFKN